ncbi:MAG: tetratricopeptide repeat protein [Nitrospiraceae bacterium]|nr:tetratricopeptide repeat protein [Nitrospiraceae bacterium]
MSLFLLAVTLAIFWQVGGHDFVDYDDGRYITENPAVASGLTPEGLKWAFTTGHAGNWHPLTWVSHMLDVSLYGLNPRGHHLTNVVFHAANAILLFLLLNGLTGTYWQSSFVAALFALHPLHVESVAWVAERKDVLSTLFWMLTLTLYVRYVEKPGRLRYLLTLSAFVLGLMSKPMLVTLPFTLFLLDYWPLGRFSSIREGSSLLSGQKNVFTPLIIEKIPFIAFSFASSLVTIYVQYKGGAVSSLDTVPFFSRIINALAAYVGYMGKMFWPLHLAVIYPLPSTESIMKGVSAGLVLAVLSFATVRLARKHPYLLMGWLWYLGTLVPVIGLVQVGRQSMADRYTYVPLIGLFIMIAWGAPIIMGQDRHRRLVLSTLGVLTLLACAAITWQQLGYWRNSITLFSHAIESVPDNDIAHVRLGYALARRGRPDEAISQYTEALRIRPRDAEAHFNMGFTLMQQGKVAEAIDQYWEVLKVDPDHEGAHINMGNALAEQGRLHDALYQYTEALRVNADNAETHFSMGLVLATQGDLEKGIMHFSEALRIRPNFAEAHYNLGIALARQGKLDEGIGHFAEALRINPGLAEARLALDAAVKRKQELR